MPLSRRKKTFISLVGATIASSLLSIVIPVSIIIAPILFGLALSVSNEDYVRYFRRQSFFLFIPVSFFLIFIWGTLPFFWLGDQVFGNDIGRNIIGCVGVFLLVSIVVKVMITKTELWWRQVIQIIILSGVCLAIVSYASDGEFTFKISFKDRQFGTGIFVYQMLMSVLISFMIKEDESQLDR
jgi:hypothetical protein